MQLKFTNTLTRREEVFKPLDKKNIRVYVCGVTPYDHSHIGHARFCVVFDILYRLLRHVYGDMGVTYVRNFTNIDDKIINRAAELGQKPAALADEMIASFHEDMKALGCLPPTHEPRVTDYMEAIGEYIIRLKEKGVAYTGGEGTALGDVNFRLPIYDQKYALAELKYGVLSGNNPDKLKAGARVEASTHKKYPADFALWKGAKKGEPAWDLTWEEGQVLRGRPGWHIECSVMSEQLLGTQFDIHGGGEDLQFPHHENEIAQCVAANGHIHANMWLHNAFITVNGSKMSKSEGNFIYIRDALKKYSGEAVRLWLLQTHYRKPVDYTEEALQAAETRLRGLYQKLAACPPAVEKADIGKTVAALADDLNTPQALGGLEENLAAARFLGLLQMEPEDYLKGRWKREAAALTEAEITSRIKSRNLARAAKKWAESDRIRDELAAQGVLLEDHPDGTTTWRRK